MPYRPLFLFILAYSFSLWTTAQVDAAPPARPHHDDVSQPHADLVTAYQGTATYHATIRHDRVETDSRWTRTETGNIHIAFDRPGQRLRVDHPDVLLIADPDKIRLRLRHLPGRYLEQDAPEQLDYPSILQILPILDDPVIPDLALLLGNDTINGLLDWPATIDSVKPENKHPDTQTIVFSKPQQSFTLEFNRESHLIKSASFDVDMDPPPNTASLQYRTTIHSHNQPLDPALFEFDTDGATAYASIRDMIQGRQPGAATGNASGGGHPLEGTDAKAMRLETLESQLTEIDPAKIDDVLVIDFWASWCGPCRMSLPRLQQFDQWAKENDQPVRVYAVNLLEPPELIRRYMKDTQLELNVLIDTDGTAAEDYGVQPIPHTVVIYEGKIQHVHIGYNPEINHKLIENVQALLKGERAQPEPTAQDHSTTQPQ